MSGIPAAGASSASSGIFPANGGVLVTHRYSGDTNAHDTGTVVAVGNGVPWLTRGQRVCFKRTACTEFEVNPSDTSIDFTGISISVAVTAPSGTERTWVALVDQRDISAVLDGTANPLSPPR